MRYGIYFHILSIVRIKWISSILSYMVFFLYFIQFELKVLKREKYYSNMTKEEAMNIINSVHEKPFRQMDIYENPKQKKEIDLSIIVPVYNYVSLIKSNVESILNQVTRYHYELILVDDGSTDGTNKVLHEYDSNPIVRIIRQDNKGIAAARNTGINNAVGKYLMFIDCDDTVYEDMVETMLNKAYKDDYDIIMCAHNLVKERDGKAYKTIPNIYPYWQMKSPDRKDRIYRYPGLPWGKIYKRRMWDNVRFLSGYWYEDTIIQWLLFPQAQSFLYIDKIEYDYRWYENNFSKVQGSSKNPKSIDRYWMLTEILLKYEEMELPKDQSFYCLLLKHLSIYYYKSFRGLDDKIIEAMFVLARDLLQHYKPNEKCRLSYVQKLTEKSLLSGDLNLWKLTSSFQ